MFKKESFEGIMVMVKRLFHVLSAATGKVRSSSVEHHVGGSTSDTVMDELR